MAGTYVRKTKDEFVIQSYWGSQYGWEDSTFEETRPEGKRALKDYRDNQPEVPHRLIKRRIRLDSVAG